MSTTHDPHAPSGPTSPGGDGSDPYAVGSHPTSAYAPPYEPAVPSGASPAPVAAVPPTGYPSAAHPPVGYPPSGHGSGDHPWVGYPAQGTWGPAQPFPQQFPSAELGGPGPFGLGAPPAGRRSTGIAATSLALGALAVPLLGLVAGAVSAVVAVAGLVLGIVALHRAGRPSAGRPAAAGRGLAVAGTTTSAVAAVLAGAVALVSTTSVGDDLAALLSGAAGDEYDIPVVALRLGEPGRVGDYTVTVDRIGMDADAALAADPRNDPPDGRYVEAVVTVTYEGRTSGVVEEDLLVSYAGSDDAWLYDEWSCSATTDRPVVEVEPLGPGESATFTSCMDVPVDVLQETAVIVEDLSSWTLTAELWGVR